MKLPISNLLNGIVNFMNYEWVNLLLTFISILKLLPVIHILINNEIYLCFNIYNIIYDNPAHIGTRLIVQLLIFKVSNKAIVSPG